MSKLTQEQEKQIKDLFAQGWKSRAIAEKVLGRKSRKSTVNYFLQREGLRQDLPTPKKGARILTQENTPIFSVKTTKYAKSGATHLIIPDTQCKKGDPTNHLAALGEYIVQHKPEVIVHLGDHADMPSLSSYDKGKGSAEGKRVLEDIDASIDAMNILLKPLVDYQNTELETKGFISYKPKMVFTLGNHEERIMRHVNNNPELIGFLSYGSLRLKDFGWEVYDYLEPVVVNGVTYTHFMANPMTGKPYGGTALNILKQVGESFTMGHKQCLDVTTRFLPSSGKQQWGVVIGAFYQHDEGYKGYQGNKHYRGFMVQQNVIDGSYDPLFVSMETLLNEYSSK